MKPEGPCSGHRGEIPCAGLVVLEYLLNISYEFSHGKTSKEDS